MKKKNTKLNKKQNLNRQGIVKSRISNSLSFLDIAKKEQTENLKSIKKLEKIEKKYDKKFKKVFELLKKIKKMKKQTNYE